MAGPRPTGLTAALEDVAAKLAVAPGEHQQQCLHLRQQLLTLSGGGPGAMVPPGTQSDGGTA
eukprot:700314-Lingulodinium_polyedra.AAC.1